VHIWDGITPVEEVMRGLDDLVRHGKVLYVGISDAPAWWVAQANILAELRGWTQFIGLQLEYSLIERTVERELIPMAKALTLGVLAFSPLAGGFLTGKYHGEGKPDGGRMTNEGMKDFLPEEQRPAPIISAVKSVSEQTGRSMAQVALAWLRHQTVPVIPIMGARKVSQLQDNLASLDLELSAEQLKSSMEQAESNTDFPKVFTTEKWFVQLGMAACGIACCSKCGPSGRILMQVRAFELPACSRVTGYPEQSTCPLNAFNGNLPSTRIAVHPLGVPRVLDSGPHD